MKKYNLRNIMRTAWKIFNKGYIDFASALKMSWANAKTLNIAREAAGVTEETHTWSGWKSLGYEVIHESKALFRAVLLDRTTKNGTRVHCYFGASQVHPIEA